MATKKITMGPSKWDIMLGYFEKNPVRFTLENGTIITMDGIDAMWDMAGYDPLDGHLLQGDNHDGGIAEGHLLRGPYTTASGARLDGEVFVEYRLRSREGHCTIIRTGAPIESLAFMPAIWSRIMGLRSGSAS